MSSEISASALRPKLSEFDEDARPPKFPPTCAPPLPVPTFARRVRRVYELSAFPSFPRSAADSGSDVRERDPFGKKIFLKVIDFL
jgi:hypothetical protein